MPISCSNYKMAMETYAQEIASRIAAGQTYSHISRVLQRRSNSSLGFSSRSIRRFCAERGIHYRCGLTDQQLDRVIASLIQSVGHSYGRRTMHGLLRAIGIHISQRRVGRSMGRVAPSAQQGIRGGIPNTLASHAPQTTHLASANIPSTSQAIWLHQNQGGRIGDEHTYGRDPLAGYEQLQQLRERDFCQMYPNMQEVFQNVVTGNGSMFKHAIKSFINCTRSFATLI